VAGSIRFHRVIEVLAQLISVRGAPQILRSDNDPEFVSKELLKWVMQSNVGLALIDPATSADLGTDLMKRLCFLSPDMALAHRVVSDLRAAGIPEKIFTLS
jgi:hypothetical protein